MLTSLPLPFLQTPEQRADKKLARQIAARFETDLEHTDVSGIRFFVNNGRVEIRGLVASEADSRLLDSIVAQIAGVKDVNNRVRAVRARVYYLSRRIAS